MREIKRIRFFCYEFIKSMFLPMKIILATTSENRKFLFERLGIVFQMADPDFEEVEDVNKSNIENIKDFALEKALSVYKKIVQNGDFCVIGFDSMVEFEGKIIGKPKTKKRAFEMLQSFVGKPQKIISGIACVGVFKGKYFEKVAMEETAIMFRSDTTNCQIRSYLEFDDWKGKCGAYSILGTGIFLLEKIEGDFQNIIGVPVMLMGEMIREITGKMPLKILERKH